MATITGKDAAPAHLIAHRLLSVLHVAVAKIGLETDLARVPGPELDPSESAWGAGLEAGVAVAAAARDRQVHGQVGVG